jgi:threonine/homoserine/homoserine lactone efflux protein
MSNPFWWIWWVSFGAAFITRYQITFSAPAAIAAFYTGHELADLAWYGPVSAMSFFGRKWLNLTVYSIVLLLCGLFISLFAVYLGVCSFVHS